jgi:ADP-ribose pyrophosphatase YjhB (NUDIX family)|tara:strand:+ start:3471 stop:4007 length:537 start_codon:yes stop_codon:yes gene_type:complete
VARKMYCIKCGSKTGKNVPAGDNIEREICRNCGYIHYVNPNIIVGALPVHSESVLLCKRDIEPGFGKWTLPSGFMEMGESLEQGAKREAHEEANLELNIKYLHTTYSLPKIGQVYMLYLSEIVNDNYAAMHETSEVKLFSINEIPWDAIAFSAVTFALKNYIEDVENGFSGRCHSNFK